MKIKTVTQVYIKRVSECTVFTINEYPTADKPEKFKIIQHGTEKLSSFFFNC